MRGRGVHRPGTGLECHVLTQDHRYLSGQPRVHQFQAFEHVTAELAEQLLLGEAKALERRLLELRGQHQHLALAGTLDRDRDISKIIVDRDGLVRRQRPRRRGPDHHRHGSSQPRRIDTGALREVGDVDHAKRHVDRGRGLVLVLHFRFGQRRAAIDAPVHGLGAAVQVAVADDLAERADLLRLVARVHRQVRVIPIAKYAQTLEVGALRLDLCRGECSAGGAKTGGIELLARLAVFLLDRELDRQPMAVPARNVRRIAAIERARLDDDVLQDLVDRVAQVDHTVRIRRAIVQHELRAAARRLADASVDAEFVPALELRGLAPGQVRFHRKVGLRQIDGGLVVGHAIPVTGANFRHRVLVARVHAARIRRASSASRPICCTIASIVGKVSSSRKRATNSTSSS